MNQRREPIVAIIILTWNQRELTLDCLASLVKTAYPLSRLQIIVVDNGSSDDTARAIREEFPVATVLENNENLGFAEGNNIGIRHALEGSAEYIMLLNNDTIVDEHMLTELVMHMEQRSDVGIAGPKMLYFEPSDVIWCAGNRIDWNNGSTIRLQAEQKDSATSEHPEEVDFITACGILLRREVIKQVGLLDPRFFIYYEETDWCTRARGKGWNILYVPTAQLWHKISAAMGTKSPATDYYMSRNVLLFLAKHLKGMRLTKTLGARVLKELLTIAAYSAKSHDGQRIPNRNARVLALRDALLGRWGKMGPDVAEQCYPASDSTRGPG